jgi:sec-independent protein translocase protein TatA
LNKITGMNTMLFLGNMGGGEWIWVLVIVLLLFGGKKIPELMRGLGRGVREFNDAKDNVRSEIEKGMKESDSEKKS